MSASAEVFARHLDLKPLRGRRRGLVRCIFHDDQTASLSLDLDRGVFNCFACHKAGGIKTFAQLVGEVTAPTGPGRRTGEGPLDAARREILERAQQQPWARDGVRALYELSDWIRSPRRKVQGLRELATSLGAEDAEAVQDALARAARVETLTFAVEHELDDLLAGGRL
jgi:CHC2-type zinc finger protein